MDAAGNLYGTAAYGGTGDCVLLGIKGGCGTVYEMSPPAQKGDPWTETTLYSFKRGNDGYVPQGNLVFDSAGNLYGATLFGGGKGTTCDPFYQYCGTVFELSPPKQKGRRERLRQRNRKHERGARAHHGSCTILLVLIRAGFSSEMRRTQC
jgi:hypothetical protein